MQKKLIKTLRIDTAYDRTHPDEKKNYGIGSMKFTFALMGDEGAVQFVLLTPFYLPHVLQMLSESPYYQDKDYTPIDVGRHSKVSLYEYDTEFDDCPYTGGKCYYDGSGLRADNLYSTFVAMGENAMWGYLLDEYNEVFHSEYSEMSEHIVSMSHE